MNFVRQLLSRVRMAPSDEELGRRTSLYPDGMPSTMTGRRSSQYPDEVPAPWIETSEKLEQYRILVGIKTHKSFKAPRGFNPNKRPLVTTAARPAPNTGIYATVVDKEIKSKQAYKWFAILINSCLGTQIVVAAALTALGAAGGKTGPSVTIFGAINTVIAGFLTYLKGSGVPNRYKYFGHEWAKVREYIEQRERDLSYDYSIDVLKEVKIIRDMFEEVRADVELNQPDRFVSVGNIGKRPVTVAPGPALSGGNEQSRIEDRMHRMESGLSDGFSRLKEKVGGIEKDIERYGSAASSEVHNVRNQVADDVGRLKNRLQERMAEIAQIERELSYQSQKMAESKEAEFEKKAEHTIREVGEREREIESSGRDAAERTAREVEVVTADAVRDAEGRIRATLEVDDQFRGGKRSS